MRALLYETRTGNPIIDLETTAWDYDTGILAPDKLSVTVPAYTKRSKSLDLRDLLTRDRHSIALIDESVEGVRRVAAAGPIVSPAPQEDPDGRHTYKVTCRGWERLLEWRQVRLYPGWPLIGADRKPTGAYDHALEGLSYGTIMKRLVQESTKWPGGDLPIVYEPDRAGVHERNRYQAVEGKQLLEALDQLADLSDGVEYDFQTVCDELDRISVHLVTGTDASRIVSGQSEWVWNLGGAQPDVRGYERDPDPTPLITDSVFSGGKDDDSVMFARGQDHGPLAQGYPRAELWDSSHSTVAVQSTLQKWADGALGGRPDRISFEVRAHVAYGVRHGDQGVLSARRHWDLPDGDYPVRVLSVGRKSSDPGWAQITLV
ncbi:hypothetical protein [Leucobacter ruminantium]|uniref:Minor tail protein n=1 Tax=Leucobacter ruminantium TaxID=1289170 RepID=A0A939M0L1_9MICO|nr:hypothetical protein [Leucobacter ruminantium]MBO1805832.1 hypothetical protein [Leucobacter ruminantium]